MIGWNISIYRMLAKSRVPPPEDKSTIQRLAVWQCGHAGLAWINRLAEDGSAVELERGGYPSRFLAPARLLTPVVLAGPPHENNPWHSDAGDVFLDHYLGRTVVDQPALSACPPDELLLIVACDES